MLMKWKEVYIQQARVFFFLLKPKSLYTFFIFEGFLFFFFFLPKKKAIELKVEVASDLMQIDDGVKPFMVARL
jgi:hypothetical protein